MKGFVVATVSGVMSAGMVYGIHAGKPIARLAVDLGTAHVYQNNPVFVVVMAGGFTVNSIFCLILSLRNRSIRQRAAGHGVPFLVNCGLATLAGILWYGQFFFYGMGTARMGEYAFAGWSIQTALVIAFSTLWGLGLKEWKGVGACGRCRSCGAGSPC